MANESSIPSPHAGEGETVTLPVYQEQLHVATRLADPGRGVRVHKRVRSHPSAPPTSSKASARSTSTSNRGCPGRRKPVKVYRGRPWDDVEPELRSNWESTHPRSAWEKFKAAVREGRDRMTA